MPVVDDLAGLAQQLNGLATDASQTPEERVAALRRFRESVLDAREATGPPHYGEYTTLAGQADTYISANELQREASAMDGTLDLARVREDAEIRDVLIAQGVATADEMDAAGWPSHAGLDAAAEDGSLEEVAVGQWKELHPQATMGQFSDKPGAAEGA
ncbi:MAG: hypothetical protein ABW167_13240 [Baekduia sp.]